MGLSGFKWVCASYAHLATVPYCYERYPSLFVLVSVRVP